MLSIITINKNNALGLEKTIASLSCLTERNFQWICIDAASNDDSMEVAKRFQAAQDVIISERDGGIYQAMNKGIPYAIYPQILFLNSGDTLSGVHSSVADLHLKSNSDITLFGFQIRKQIRMPRNNAWRIWSMPTSHQAIIYSKALLEREPFDVSYRYAADFEHYLRINRKTVGQALRIDRQFTPLIVNEPYGSDANLPQVLAEYKRALITNGYPKIWGYLVYHIKKHYLKWALKL